MKLYEIGFNKMEKQKFSDCMWCLRAIAIISVICAHCNVNTEIFNNIVIKYEAHTLSNIGTIGVGVFFFSSGYFYKVDNEFINKKRLCNETLPWILAATMVWLYVVLRKGNITIKSWLCFVLGYNSIYYFMVDLILIRIIYFIFVRIVKDIRIVYGICVILNAVSIFGITKGFNYTPTPYLNPLIFISYFSLGNVFSKYNISSNMLNKVCLVIPAVFATVIALSKIDLTYYMGIEEIIIETLFICVIYFGITSMNHPPRLLVNIGKMSFALYLWHIPFAGIISNLGNRKEILQYFAILWPVVVLILTVLLVSAIEKVIYLFGREKYKYILGIR